MQAAAVAVWTILWVISYVQAWDFSNLDENDVCRDDGDQVWRCLKAGECAATAELIRRGELIMCSPTNRRNPLVCCPPSTSDRNLMSQSISQQKCQEYKEALCYQTFNYIEPGQRLSSLPPSTLQETVSPVSTNIDEEVDWLMEAGKETQDQGTTMTQPRVSMSGNEETQDQGSTMTQPRVSMNDNEDTENQGTAMMPPRVSMSGNEKIQDQDSTMTPPRVSVNGNEETQDQGTTMMPPRVSVNGNEENQDKRTTMTTPRVSVNYNEKTQDQGTTLTTPRVSVVGGEVALVGEHPHMALIGYGPEVRISWVCGGSLISERFVLSAAHCAKTEEPGKTGWVLLGALDIKDKDGADSRNRQQFRIIKQYVHEYYQSPLIYNDIVLFRLDRDVKFTRFVAPACLYQGLAEPQGNAVVTGWGRNESSGPTMSLLQKATLSFLPPKTCKKRVGVDKIMLPEGIQLSSQFCAWEYHKDTCTGDSGGPLVKAEKDSCLAQQVGITSFGHTACGKTKTPGTYVRVAYFLPWIESIVWPSTNSSYSYRFSVLRLESVYLKFLIIYTHIILLY